MRISRTIPVLADAPVALTIGNFDGVHLGHQAMLARLSDAARARGLISCVMTFEPHPREFFMPDRAPTRIALLRDKLESLRKQGVDRVVVEHFNAHFAGQTPDEFVRNVLVDGLHTRWLLVGDDFRFGAKRAGDYAMLDAAGEARGFDVARMLSYEVHGERVSSSVVREALTAGDMARVATPLGQWPVWQRCAWMQPIASIASRATATTSQPSAKANSTCSGKPSLPEPLNTTLSWSPRSAIVR